MAKGMLPTTVKCPAKVSVLIATLRKEFPREMAKAEEKVRAERGAIGGAARFAIVGEMCCVLSIDMRTGDEKAAASRWTCSRSAMPSSRWAAYQQAVARSTYEASSAFLESYEWRRVRMQAIKKYGSRCQCCGATPADGAVMNVDHIKPRRLFPQLALDIDNLQILCNPCNHGKGNWDMTDWRKPAATDWVVREPEETWAAEEFEACKADWEAAGLDALVKEVLWDTKNGVCMVMTWNIAQPTAAHWAKVREVFRNHISQFEVDGIIYHRDDFTRDYAVEGEQ
jgi:5-methylcytosine-specific restriction endonuclease McrA